jgi:pyrroloquinoline quinone (PQQ) biosynthesis protein C
LAAVVSKVRSDGARSEDLAVVVLGFSASALEIQRAMPHFSMLLRMVSSFGVYPEVLESHFASAYASASHSP